MNIFCVGGGLLFLVRAVFGQDLKNVAIGKVRISVSLMVQHVILAEGVSKAPKI